MVSLRKKKQLYQQEVLEGRSGIQKCSGMLFWCVLAQIKGKHCTYTHTNNKYIISNTAHTSPAYCSQQHLDINNAYNSTQITTHKANERCAETFRLEFRTHPLPCRVGTWQQNRKKKIIYKFSIFRKQVRHIITTTLGTTSINCYHLQYSLP